MRSLTGTAGPLPRTSYMSSPAPFIDSPPRTFSRCTETYTTDPNRHTAGGLLMECFNTDLMRLIRHPFRRKQASRGQALVEFALVVLPLLLLIVGIVQFGLLLNANVTLTNAAREGARAGSVYVYKVGTINGITYNQAVNDRERCTAVVTAVRQALGLLDGAAPHFSAATPCPVGSGNLWTNGDVVITYTKPGTVTTNDPRVGYEIKVHITYRQDIIVPFVGPLLSTDANGRFVHDAEVIMVVN